MQLTDGDRFRTRRRLRWVQVQGETSYLLYASDTWLEISRKKKSNFVFSFQIVQSKIWNMCPEILKSQLFQTRFGAYRRLCGFKGVCKRSVKINQFFLVPPTSSYSSIPLWTVPSVLFISLILISTNNINYKKSSVARRVK